MVVTPEHLAGGLLGLFLSVHQKGHPMDKTLAGLLGGASALALVGAVQAANVPAEPSGSLKPAQSYAELLDPIPNAAELLKVDNLTRDSDVTAGEPSMQLAQYHHHHHHHHHHRRHHHHHYF